MLKVTVEIELSVREAKELNEDGLQVPSYISKLVQDALENDGSSARVRQVSLSAE